MAIFLLGAGYGAMWNRCVADVPMFTRPTTPDELAKVKASIAKSSTSPARHQPANNLIDELQP